MSNLRTESVERSIIVSARAAITKLVTVIIHAKQMYFDNHYSV